MTQTKTLRIADLRKPNLREMHKISLDELAAEVSVPSPEILIIRTWRKDSSYEKRGNSRDRYSVVVFTFADGHGCACGNMHFFETTAKAIVQNLTELRRGQELMCRVIKRLLDNPVDPVLNYYYDFAEEDE